jgi:hypothetical protein
MMMTVYQIVVILLIVLCIVCILGSENDKEFRNIMAAVLIACILSLPLTFIF